MTERELSFIVENISREERLPMDNVASVIRRYYAMLELGRCTLEGARGIAWGVPSLDSSLELNKGLTMISGHESCGKTSLLKQIAISARAQGLTVAYYDSDNKLFLHDLTPMMNMGILFANSYRNSGLTEIARAGLIDVLLIDSLTSLHETSQHSFLVKLKKYVPYIIYSTQTRSEWGTGKTIAACDPRILSMSNCEIMLSSKEQITIEAENVARIQYKVMKNEIDRAKERAHGSFILKANITDVIYTSFDILRARGRIRSIGEVKYLDKVDIGKVKHLSRQGNEQKRRLIIQTACEEIGLDWSAYERIYFPVHRPMRNMRPLQIETSQDQAAAEATPERELEDPVCPGEANSQ